MSEFYYNKDYFKIIDDEHKAYWLGFLYADGYVEPIYRKDKIKAFRLELILQANDEEMLFLLKSDLNTNANITDRIIKSNDKEYYAKRIRINNTELCRDLIRLGCIPKKSLVLKFPNYSVVPQQFISHFIRGYSDGDGCVSYYENNYIDKRNNKEYLRKHKVCSFIGNEEFLSSMVIELKKCDILFKFVKKSHSGKATEIRIEDNTSLIRFYNYLYNNSSICMLRKKEKFQEIIKQII